MESVLTCRKDSRIAQCNAQPKLVMNGIAVMLTLKFSEKWILPLTVLFAIMAYVVLAIVFYNNNG